MEYFRFVPPTILVLSTMALALPFPSPQVAFSGGIGGPPPSSPVSAPSSGPPSPPQTRFLGFQQHSAPVQGFQQHSAPVQGFQQQSGPVRGFQQQSAPVQGFQQQSGPVRGFQQQSGPVRGFQQQSAPATFSGPVSGSGHPPHSRFLGHQQQQPVQTQGPQSPHSQQVFGGFGGIVPSVNANPNQGLQNLGATAGLGGIGAIAATNCLFKQNCDLAFRPSLGAAIDANGNIIPQLGVTTQVGDGRDGFGTTFTSGVQLGGGGESGIGGFVAGGINDGNPDSIGVGAQTGFGLNQNSNGGLDATAQLGGNVQAPQLAGVNFHRPNTALGVEPTVLGQAQPQFNLLNLFQPQNNQGGQNNPFGGLFGR